MLIAALFLVIILAAIAWIDAKRQIIPDALNLALAAGGLACMYFLAEPYPADALAGGMGGFAVLWALRRFYARLRGIQGLGLGDVKFTGAAGLWIGATGLPWMMLIAALSGLAWSLLLGVANGKWDARQRLSFGPHLCLGLFAAWMARALEVW
jgi:leader peptidase (prepilin peptidase) / N-methyltransferase